MVFNVVNFTPKNVVKKMDKEIEMNTKSEERNINYIKRNVQIE